MNEEEIKIFLPKYLSADSKSALIEALRDFPHVAADRFYTAKLKESEIIYQGDGLRGFVHIELPKTDVKIVDAIIFSNTCDIATENVRHFESRMIYAPIISLKRYMDVLFETGIDPEKARTHIESIKNQHITQIFYLPGLDGIIKDSIVFFDRVLNVRPDYVGADEIREKRIFSLSNYGHYLLLFKLSFHLCRFQDKVDRN